MSDTYVYEGWGYLSRSPYKYPMLIAMIDAETNDYALASSRFAAPWTSLRVACRAWTTWCRSNPIPTSVSMAPGSAAIVAALLGADDDDDDEGAAEALRGTRAATGAEDAAAAAAAAWWAIGLGR